MTIGKLILFFIANKDAIMDLVALIRQLLEQFKPGTVVTLSDDVVIAAAQTSPHLVDALNAEGMSLRDLIQFIIDNREGIKDLIQMIIDLVGSLK